MNEPDPSWLPNNGASKWITPSSAALNMEYGGEYVYRTVFQTSALSVHGWYASDNELLGIYQNGVSVPVTFVPLNSPTDFNRWTAFTIVTAGLNTLDFVVRNRGQGGLDPNSTVTGLRVHFAVPGCGVILPQLAFGGGWYSSLYFTNATPFQISFPISFFSDSGTPLMVPSVGASSTIVTLGPQGTTIIEAPNSGSLVQGYVSTQLPPGVVSYGIFRQSIPGIPDQEAVVPLSLSGTSVSTLTWDDTNFTTAVAIANPTNNAETITITVWDASGAQIGTSSVNLPPNGKTEGALRNLPGLGGMAGKRGSATFSANTGGSVVVLGLRFGGSAFTSIPVTAQ